LGPYATVLKKDAFVFLREKPSQSFNFVYVAPPQYRNLWFKTMQILDENPDWVNPWDVVIVQIHPKEINDVYDYANFREFDRRDYGDTLLIFFERFMQE